MTETLMTYLPDIVTILAFIIGVMVNILTTKNSNLNKTISNLSYLMPYWVADAESKGFSSGEAKKNYVVELSMAYLTAHLKKDIDYCQQHYLSTVDCLIENVLSTPQKKEITK